MPAHIEVFRVGAVSVRPTRGLMPRGFQAILELEIGREKSTPIKNRVASYSSVPSQEVFRLRP